MALFNNTPMQPTVADLQELISSRIESIQSGKGIAAKPEKVSASKEDLVLGYFREVFNTTKEKADSVRGELAPTMEVLARESALLNAQEREAAGITQSLVEGGGEAYRTKPPEGTITRPVARPDELVTDTAKDEQESTPVTAETKGAGLMSRKMDGKDGNLSESYDELEMDAYLDAFIPEMAVLEGMGGDVVLGDLEPTYSYGITEAKATEYGMQPEDYGNMEDFARAFAARYRKEKQEMYPEVFTADLDKDVEKGLQSYLWNRGSFYPGQLGALSDGNLNGFIDELKDVVNAADTTTANNQSRPMSGLSKRRAAEANLVGRGIEGYVPVATVETTGTQQKPIFIWKDAQGNEVNRFVATKPLHSMSTMGEIAVPN